MSIILDEKKIKYFFESVANLKKTTIFALAERNIFPYNGEE